MYSQTMTEGESGALVVIHFAIPSVANLRTQHKVFISLLPIADRRARRNMRAPDARSLEQRPCMWE
jgi:hypothetical protein